MTRDEAIEIRRRQLCGEQVEPAMLAEAIDAIKATAHQQQSAPAPKKPRGPKKSEATKAKRREAVSADMESRADRGNRLLLAKLRACMPWWDGTATAPLDRRAVPAPALPPDGVGAQAVAQTAAALVFDHGRAAFSLVPVQYVELPQEPA